MYSRLLGAQPWTYKLWASKIGTVPQSEAETERKGTGLRAQVRSRVTHRLLQTMVLVPIGQSVSCERDVEAVLESTT